MFELSGGTRGGRPLVFVHGFGVSTRHLRPAILEFADGWQVCAFDVAAPTLVVRGERDAIVSAAWAREVAARIPRARLVLVAGAAHAVHFSHPNALRAVAERFLSTSDV